LLNLLNKKAAANKIVEIYAWLYPAITGFMEGSEKRAVIIAPDDLQNVNLCIITSILSFLKMEVINSILNFSKIKAYTPFFYLRF
jgi:hypothetical protein